MPAPRSTTSVSFVIPVKDDALRLRRCLQSIRRNDVAGVDVDVVVVDNGSTDESKEVARAAGALVVDGPGRRVAALRNLGAKAARGDILAFVDADHEIGSQWIRTVVDCLGERRIGAAGAPCAAPPNGTWVQRWYDRMRSKQHGRHRVDWLGAGNMAVRRDAFERAGGFDASLDTCEDVDLCFRLKRAGYGIVSDDEIRNTHFGDPATLGAVFRGEMWRGRDNLRVTFRGPWTIRHLRSALVPIFDIAALAVIVSGLVAASTWGLSAAATAATAALFLSFLRAHMMLGGAPFRFRDAASAFAVAAAYDAGRAWALVARASHRVRRTG